LLYMGERTNETLKATPPHYQLTLTTHWKAAAAKRMWWSVLALNQRHYRLRQRRRRFPFWN